MPEICVRLRERIGRYRARGKSDYEENYKDIIRIYICLDDGRGIFCLWSGDSCSVSNGI